MPSKIKAGLNTLKNIGIVIFVLPYIPMFINFFHQTGKYVGFFIKNVYFFVIK